MKKSVLASLMLAGGAVLLWVSSRLAWLTVTADDDKAGTKTVNPDTWTDVLQAFFNFLIQPFRRNLNR